MTQKLRNKRRENKGKSDEDFPDSPFLRNFVCIKIMWTKFIQDFLYGSG